MKAEFTGIHSADLVDKDCRDPLFKSNPNNRIQKEDSMEEINPSIRAVTIKVPIKVEDMNLLAVVDTGAEVTVMRDSLYRDLPLESRPEIKDARCGLVVADKGHHMETQGMVKLPLNLGGHQFEWDVYLAPITDDLLLGCDIIDELDLTLNTSEGLGLNGKWIPCTVDRRLNQVSRVQLKETVTIPASSKFLTTGKIIGESSFTSQYATIEPIFEELGELMIARAVVDTLKQDVQLRFINLPCSPVMLERGHPVAELCDFEFLLATGLQNSNSAGWPTPLRLEDPVLPLSALRATYTRDVLPPTLLGMQEYTGTLARARGTSEECMREKGHLESNRIGICRVNAGNSTIPEHLTELFERSIKNLNDDEKHQLLQVLIKNQDAFAKSKDDLGSCSVIKHYIDTCGAAPIRQPPRRVPKEFEAEEEKYLQDQLESGVVVPSSSAWASPIVLVRKKSDNTVRWCIDYRRLNEVTVKDAYPIPRIDMSIDCLGSAQYFTTLDLQAGYWQLELEESSRAKTAFITKYGLYEYTKLPFGLCNAPSTFQRCMELIFRGLQWSKLLIYLDDIIIFSKDIEQHFERLSEVLIRLKEAGLNLKPSKCELLKPEVLFLGHIVSKEGIHPNPKLIEDVVNWDVPCNVKDVQQFLGLCNYYRRFIHKFSDIASPLTQLTKKEVKFVWDSRCQRSFEKLKQVLCEAPVLSYPMKEGEFILDCDASDTGIGGVLSQLQEGEERPICYASKKLDKQQQRYCVTRRELLAAVTFIHQFRHYLLGREFKLRTDHSSLRWLFSFKDPQGQMARWLEVLAQYNFKIVHREGKKHGNADSLSRQYTGAKPDECYLANVALEQLPCQGCKKCQKMKESWEQFHDEIDTVIPLVLQPTQSKQHGCRRETTRGQKKKDAQSNDNTSTINEPPEGATSTQPWIGRYTNEEMSHMQQEDSDLSPVYKWLKEGQRCSRDESTRYSPATRKLWLNWDNLCLENEVMYQRWLSSEGFPEKLQLLVPYILREEVLAECHSSILAAHFGIEKSTQTIKRRFYWYRLSRDVKRHIQECPVCDVNKHPHRPLRAALNDYRVGAPMDRVAIDIMGPLPISQSGNSYLLVLGDYFTRWMEAYPIPDQQAETVARKLVNEFISRFGVPLEIHSDQGRNFESELFQHVCSELGITKTRTTPYRPSSNGLVERFNRTLAQMIRNFIGDNKQNWDVHVPLLTSAYRSTINPATGFTPNFLMFGREVHLPIDLLYPRPQAEEPKEVHEYASNLIDKMHSCYQLARKHLHEAAQRQKKDYDTRIVESQYKPGDLVYKRHHIHKKLEIPWQGPFVVLKPLGNSIYRITDKKKARVVHHDLLKPYYSAFIPNWAIKIKEQLNKAANIQDTTTY